MGKLRVRYAGYSFMADNMYGYAYFASKDEYCYMYDTIGSESFAHMSGYGQKLESTFDRDSTLRPGLTRLILYTDTQQEAFRIVFREHAVNGVGELENHYLLVLKNEVTDVRFSGDEFIFEQGLDLLSQIRRVITPSRQQAKTDKREHKLCFDVEFEKPLPQELVLAILSFPLLEFT